jgi:integrase
MHVIMCLMAGMNPAFIAAQPRHSVQVPLSAPVMCISPPNDRAELEMPESNTTVVRTKTSSAQDAEHKGFKQHVRISW